MKRRFYVDGFILWRFSLFSHRKTNPGMGFRRLLIDLSRDMIDIMILKPRVYLETTVPSYLTGWPSRDIVRAAHQRITQEWWGRRHEYELFISQLVVRECQSGDPQAAATRLAALEGLPLLEQNDMVMTLARSLREQVPMPERATADALHIATATAHGMDYLLSWNCAHIANATLRGRIEMVCRNSGYEPPVICTPEALRGGYDDDRG